MIYKKLFREVRCRRHEGQFNRATILEKSAAGQLIKSNIESGKPLMVSRIGATEMTTVNIWRQRNNNPIAKKLMFLLDGIKVEYNEQARSRARNNSGIFPTTDEGLDEFSCTFVDACTRIDILAIWRISLPLEELLWKESCPKAKLITLSSIEPYRSEIPWSAALNGKKVLVIHPFEESIASQYKKRELLFPESSVLPEFDLKIIKSVQTNAGGESEFTSWREALESMKEKIKATDFDIALIGAGGYGLPLAAYVKDLGKQAIHVGGSLQLLFGIKGRRWDDRPEISCFYNEHWVRPLVKETPPKFETQSGGCYW